MKGESTSSWPGSSEPDTFGEPKRIGTINLKNILNQLEEDIVFLRKALLSCVTDFTKFRCRKKVDRFKRTVLAESTRVSAKSKKGGTPRSLWLDSDPNLGPLVYRWEINKFENCWYKSVRILEVLKLLFQQFLNFSSFPTRYECSNIRRPVQL